MPKKTRLLSTEAVGRGQLSPTYNPKHKNLRLLSTRQMKRKQKRQGRKL